MKRVLFSLIFILTLGITGASAQCGESLTQTALKEIGDSQYIKDFAVDLKKAKPDAKTGAVTFKVILNSKNHYKFNMVNGSQNTEEVIMQLYDGDRLLVSNFEGGKMYKATEFVCRTTKAYNLTFSFKGGEEGCAAAVLSLVKQYSEGEMGF
ncbi:MAG: hypothetical protein LBV41_07955 [Cytophagaceae bacterium]|nr:hypothetical protein [Cytophagaceae bacterium]